VYNIREFAKLLGITPQTLRVWEKEGKIKPVRTKGRHRRYDDEMLREIVYKSKPQVQKKTVLYARVSSNGQIEDLKRQISQLETFANSRGYCYEIYQDIGSGLNFNRKEFNKLVMEILSGKVDRVVLNYKDRLMRFGFELFERICQNNNTEIVIINQTEAISTHPYPSQEGKEELTKDLIAIITSFSAKLYGARSHKNKRLISEVKNVIYSEDTVESNRRTGEATF
jgi:excisionase family DNA binding protein